jgi:hypothetical protein
MNIKSLKYEKQRVIFLINFFSLLLLSFSNNMNITKWDRKVLIDLKKLENNYVAPIWLGSSNQIMNVIFSTGNYLSIIPSIQIRENGYNFLGSGEFRNFTGPHSMVS